MSESTLNKGIILIVDDQVTNLKLLTTMLTGRGYRVRSASNGPMAIEMTREFLPALILLDIKMPGMDGYQVCEYLKANERTRDIPIIFATVLDETEDKVKAFAAGAVDYVTKPLRMREVLARVETHLTLRAVQKQLEEKNAQLEREIAERAQAEEALGESEKQLRQQEQLAAIGRLVGGIAHDFNNLMSTIILCAQMSLTRRDLPAQATEAFETILDESRRAAKLVRQIQGFGHSSMIEMHPLDIVPVVKETIGVLQRTFPENIRITLDAPGSAPLIVEADPARIQQALINLALNARDAMPEGGELHLELFRTSVQPGEEWVCLTVTDTGAGMTEETEAHLFEPFFTTKPAGEGTGLGLAQVYGIVKQHNGHIRVETELGEGTVFHIYLPAHEEEVAEPEEKQTEKPLAPTPGREETILLVEDAERLRKAMQEILESLGYRVLTAANGQDALEIFRSTEGLNLVIADLVMPTMGGKQLIQALKKASPGLKALAITGYMMETNLQELKQVGFLDVVPKPFDAERLAKTIRRILDAD
jgi:CheY-like chemotaxis protein